MYYFHIKAIVNRLAKDGLVADSNLTEEVIADYFADKIAIIWNAGDVLCREDAIAAGLCVHDATRILDNVLEDHDAELGVNWSCIDYKIQEYVKACDV